MAENIIKTKIALRYNTYEYWTTGAGKDYKPLAGEVCFCAIASKDQGAQTAPTVLFKVGDGVNLFSGLKWASALAADVYDWAKASTKPKYIASEIEGLDAYIGGKVEDTNTDTRYRFTTDGDKLVVYETVYNFDVAGTETKVGEYEFLTATEVSNMIGKADITIQAGSGLTTGGSFNVNASTNKTITLSHQNAPSPTKSSAVGSGGSNGTRTYVQEVLVDGFGHVAGVKLGTETDQNLSNYKTKQTEKSGSFTGAQVLGSWSQNANGEVSITSRSLTPADIGAQPSGNYKTKQTAVSDPTASGTSVSFISSISQDANGVITVQKKTVTAEALGLDKAIRFIGVTDTAITDGSTTSQVHIVGTGAEAHTAVSGDVVIYGNKEFIFTSAGTWEEFGNEGDYALRTVTITGNNGLTGGGDLTQNRTIGIATGGVTLTHLSKGVTDEIDKGVIAYGWGNHASAGYALTKNLGTLAGKDTITASDITGTIGVSKITDFSTEVAKVKVTNATNADQLGGTVASSYATKSYVTENSIQSIAFVTGNANGTIGIQIDGGHPDTFIYGTVKGLTSTAFTDLSTLAKKAELATIATSGSVYDLIEAETGAGGTKYLILDCNW